MAKASTRTGRRPVRSDMVRAQIICRNITQQPSRAAQTGGLLLRRTTRCTTDLADGAEVICEVCNARHDPIELDGADLDRLAQRIEPPMRLVAKLGPELLPFAV